MVYGIGSEFFRIMTYSQYLVGMFNDVYFYPNDCRVSLVGKGWHCRVDTVGGLAWVGIWVPPYSSGVGT